MRNQKLQELWNRTNPNKNHNLFKATCYPNKIPMIDEGSRNNLLLEWGFYSIIPHIINLGGNQNGSYRSSKGISW